MFVKSRPTTERSSPAGPTLQSSPPWDQGVPAATLAVEEEPEARLGLAPQPPTFLPGIQIRGTRSSLFEQIAMDSSLSPVRARDRGYFHLPTANRLRRSCWID